MYNIKKESYIKPVKTYTFEKKSFIGDFQKDTFYIVGIAGGEGSIKSFQSFFSVMPVITDMAFILLPQLEAKEFLILTESIKNVSKMKVIVVEDGIEIQPNCIYINPIGMELSIMDGILKLSDIDSSAGMKMPVNFFFNHLAKEVEDRGICILFSGMGNDGILSLRSIKERFGLIMVQSPETADYSSMPQSAVNTNLVDFIMPVEEMPAKLIGYSRSFVRSSSGRLEERKNSYVLKRIYNLLKNQTGRDFSLYKKNTIFRRIERRMNFHKFETMSDYLKYLQENHREIDMLFNELLIGVTSFFREPEAFEYLKSIVIPDLLKSKLKEKKIRIWVTGCSTGEEAYSIAIIIRECMENLRLVNLIKVSIFATDINNQAIEIARQGIYDLSIEDYVSKDRVSRFFVKTEDQNFQIKKEIRDMIVFAPHSIIMDPPFMKLDMLCCRNLLIYFSTELQKKLLPIFHYSLNPGGILFLGSSETIGEYTSLFSIKESRMRIFERKESVYSLSPMVEFISAPVPRQNIKTNYQKKNVITDIPDMVQRALLEDFVPPAVVINETGDIIYVSGRTGEYLEPSPGKANFNIFAMAREGIKYELGKTIRNVIINRSAAVIYGLNVKLNSGDKYVNITVSPLNKTEKAAGLFIVVFEDITNVINSESIDTNLRIASDQTAAVLELEDQLLYKNEYLQSTIEEMETSQEELKSMNEELQLTNEELQSTNEELKTSREELQSLNEELLTINSEMQLKNYELSQANNDMRNLLYSTQIATIFLDNNLNIKRFTPEITRIISLIQTDVGRPISDIVQKLKYSELICDAKEVLETLVFKEVQVQTMDENWFNMRILPYRTVENVIDGVVITFNDITTCKFLEMSLEKAKNFAWDIISTVREPIVVLDEKLKIVTANLSFYNKFQVTPEETEKQFIYDLGNGQWNIPELKHLLEEILPKKTEFQGFMVNHEFPDIGFRVMLLNARMVYNVEQDFNMVLLAFEDISDRSNKQ